MTIQDKLERLAEMQSHQDVIRLHYADLKATIIPPEIKAQLDESTLKRRPPWMLYPAVLTA